MKELKYIWKNILPVAVLIMGLSSTQSSDGSLCLELLPSRRFHLEASVCFVDYIFLNY